MFGAVGLLDNWCNMMVANGKNLVTLASGGLGWFSFISRVLFAAICVCLGILIFKGYRVLINTETSHEEVIEIANEDEPQKEEVEETVEQKPEPEVVSAQ